MRDLNRKKLSADLHYSIAHRPRVTRRMHMELDDNGELVVVVPLHWPRAFVHKTLVNNLQKVERFLTNTRNHAVKPLLYSRGETHLYLGEHYPLVISGASAKKSSVTLMGGEIHMLAASRDREDLKRHLQNWYRKQASSVFHGRLLEVSRSAPWVGKRQLSLKLRRMKRTWGNCSSRGVIKLNTHLVKAPVRLIDSVIAHELCHLEEMNHGRAFYALLERLNPEWRKDRAELRANGPAYLLT